MLMVNAVVYLRGEIREILSTILIPLLLVFI
jgi:hypothetical protein